jgi:hypothetical protein
MTVEYQNIFTRVQVRGPHYAGIPIGAETENRIGKPVDNYWAGRSAMRRSAPSTWAVSAPCPCCSASSPSRSSA